MTGQTRFARYNLVNDPYGGLMKTRYFATLACALAILLPVMAHADLEFTFSPNPLTVDTQRNGTFQLFGELYNNGSDLQSFDITDYALTVTSGSLNLPFDLNDDRTNFDLNFVRTFAPGDHVSAPLLDFTVGPDAPLGAYTINLELRDGNSNGLTNQSFDMNIKDTQPVPESSTMILTFFGSAPLVTLAWHKCKCVKA